MSIKNQQESMLKIQSLEINTGMCAYHVQTKGMIYNVRARFICVKVSRKVA